MNRKRLESIRMPRTQRLTQGCLRGYTLIELIVSVALFSIVMLIATAAFLKVIQLDRQARATNDVVTNLSYVVDSMARSVRTGSEYVCGTGDCESTPRDTFTFTDADGRSVSYGRNGGSVEQCIDGTCMPITDPRITVGTLAFYARGTASGQSGDVSQPFVVFTLHGSIVPDSSSAPIEFTIESAASQRLIDI